MPLVAISGIKTRGSKQVVLSGQRHKISPMLARLMQCLYSQLPYALQDNWRLITTCYYLIFYMSNVPLFSNCGGDRLF